eukprot:6214826-Pleurochrysis_carterae.AAC.6
MIAAACERMGKELKPGMMVTILLDVGIRRGDFSSGESMSGTRKLYHGDAAGSSAAAAAPGSSSLCCCSWRVCCCCC